MYFSRTKEKKRLTRKKQSSFNGSMITKFCKENLKQIVEAVNMRVMLRMLFKERKNSITISFFFFSVKNDKKTIYDNYLRKRKEIRNNYSLRNDKRKNFYDKHLSKL